MIHYRATIAYTGNTFYGFKQTAIGPTVQGELQRALEQVFRHPVVVEGASLTDRGVHAEGQVIQFASPKAIDPYKLLASLRGLLPKTIAPLDVQTAPRSFHPSLDATHKEYHYTISNRPSQLPVDLEFAWHIPLPLCQSKMEKAIPQLLGRHDFSTFSNQTYEDPIRHLMDIDLISVGSGKLRIEITGDRFLYKMVRNLVGTLAWVGLAKIPFSEVSSILASLDRRRAGPTAPAHGLTLKRVYY